MIDMTNNIEQQAAELGVLLHERGWVVGTAESCTGGMVAAAITDIAGSSGWFDEGLVTYANHSKQRLLGVQQADLDAEGAVSRAVVEAMALGVVARGAQVSVATSGIAGPGGGNVEKPVGTVWFAWCIERLIVSECAHFSGNRQQVRSKATAYALSGLLRHLACL
jgi:nicotinamide-nucleotide amidase